jgi:hypothetical protein
VPNFSSGLASGGPRPSRRSRTSPGGSRACSCLSRLRGVQHEEVEGVHARPSTPGRMRSPAPVVPEYVGVVLIPPSVSLPVLPTNLSPLAWTDTDRCPRAAPCRERWRPRRLRCLVLLMPAHKPPMRLSVAAKAMLCYHQHSRHSREQGIAHHLSLCLDRTGPICPA